MRLFREPSDETRDKMSSAHKNKTLSYQTKQRISKSMKKYWAGVPSMPEHTTMDELLGASTENNKGTVRQPPKKI